MFLQRRENRKVAPVAKSWARLENWYKANLPEVLPTLRPPATAQQIQEFEKAAGLKIPDDWRESLLIHDGQDEDVPTGALAGLPLEPLDCVLSHLRFWRSLVKDIDEGDVDPDDSRETSNPPYAIKCQHQNANWIPLDSWDGNCWGIDLDPGPAGVMGQIINFGRDDEAKFVLALSLAQFLEDMADEMEAGNLPVVRYKTDGDGCRLEDEDIDDDMEVKIQCDFGPPEAHKRADVCAVSLANYYSQWSEAKLPRAFKNASPNVVEPASPGEVVAGDPAMRGRQVVEQFIQAMHAFELKWLEVRPIHKLGYSYVQESIPGIGICSSVGLKMESRFFGYNATPMPTTDEAIAKLQFEKYAVQAVAERNEIWERFGTDRERTGSLEWEQHYPLKYDPARDRVEKVRKLSPDRLIVYMQPVEDATTRYHLARVGTDWRIDVKDEASGDEKFKRVPL